MPPPSQPANPPAKRPHDHASTGSFWQRVTEGLELSQLWNQFRVETHATYRLYSHEIESISAEGVSKNKVWWAKQFFLAVLDKLSPARRIILLLALAMIFVGHIEFSHDSVHIGRPPALQHSAANKPAPEVFDVDLRLCGSVLLFFLLILEVGDRVVMKRDLQIAREIQTWLLPASPPQVPGIEIAFETRPANTVAGDYYDIFPRNAPDSRAPTYLIAIADVVGKSMPAALLMATFQASLKTLSATHSSLEQLICGMNDYACTNSQGGLRFTTAFFAQYEPETRVLRYINAGHNQPILRRASGRIERLDAGGIPLGVQDKVDYETASVTLEPGDWLVLFTDGVIEAINARDDEYGEPRLMAVIKATTQSSPASMLKKIMADVTIFVGDTPQHDDITCLLIKVV